jgi:signal transduction histidine kinase
VVERRDELGELAREFNSMADYVEQTLDTQQRLLQDVSHELRAPLARLQAAAGLAEQRWGIDDKSLQRIVRECGNLDSLISEILSLAREAQEMADSPQESVAALLEQSIEEAQILGPNHSFALLTSELRANANISREPLQRILSNLLNNAINHTSEGTAVTVSASSSANTLKLVVSDTGEGVAPELLASLVEPFRRGKSSKGYGLGLSIVARAAERVGGSVVFTSPEGTGLRVEIKLPLATK